MDDYINNYVNDNLHDDVRLKKSMHIKNINWKNK